MAKTTHELKVVPPYYEALASGSKTFEVRKNDRTYQAGDTLILREWHPWDTSSTRPCESCGWHTYGLGHWKKHHDGITVKVSFVYSGDPRFGGLEPGYVVLGLAR